MERTWAGIGSRKLANGEAARLAALARHLTDQGWWLHSGNADGADVAFQSGASGRGTAFLPWPGHNPANLHGMEACTEITPEALATARRLHPKGRRLDGKALLFMARNVQIVEGLRGARRCDAVVCCADPLPDGVEGGSSLAWSLARELGIPCFNLRTEGDEERFLLWAGAPPPLKV